MTDVAVSPVIAAGNIAVITGGASGIGLAVAERLIERDMSVLLADIDAPNLRAVEARLTEAGADVAIQVCDTASEAAVAALADVALDRFGAAHLLFNNAGIAGVGDAWTGSIDLWHRVIDINLFGVVHGIRSFLPIMQQQGVGHIVNTASMAGLVAMPGAAPYNATKHAVVAISEGLYLELGALSGGAASPIGISVLCPGFVKTDLMSKEPDIETTSLAGLIGDALRSGIDGGIEASAVAARVVSAVDDGRFWILTHDDTAQLPVERMQRAASGTNPPPFGQG